VRDHVDISILVARSLVTSIQLPFTLWSSCILHIFE